MNKEIYLIYAGEHVSAYVCGVSSSIDKVKECLSWIKQWKGYLRFSKIERWENIGDNDYRLVYQFASPEEFYFATSGRIND